MHWLLAMIVVLAFMCGCSQQQSESRNAVSPPRDIVPSMSNAPNELSGSNTITSADYPEKTEVERLLSRAVQLESDGKFQQALAIVNEALGIDAHSPRASTLKQRLEEIIRRI